MIDLCSHASCDDHSNWRNALAGLGAWPTADIIRAGAGQQVASLLNLAFASRGLAHTAQRRSRSDCDPAGLNRKSLYEELSICLFFSDLAFHEWSPGGRLCGLRAHRLRNAELPTVIRIGEREVLGSAKQWP